jgi:hypothetical protein
MLARKFLFDNQSYPLSKGSSIGFGGAFSGVFKPLANPEINCGVHLALTLGLSRHINSPIDHRNNTTNANCMYNVLQRDRNENKRMNYLNLYKKMMACAETLQDYYLSSDLYLERHHKIPKGLGGSDSSGNLVYLPARLHFVAHVVLHRALRKKETAAAINAMCMNTVKRYGKVSSRLFAYARAEYAKSIAGEGNPFKNKTHSKEQKEKWSLIRKGKVACHETKSKMSNSQKKRQKSFPNKGINWTENQKRVVSNTMKEVIQKRGGHWNIGYKHTQETLEMLSSSSTGKNNPMYGSKYFWITNGVVNKRNPLGDACPEGFVKGKFQSPMSKNIWITNGVINKRVSSNDECPEGFRFGRQIKRAA